MDIQTETVRLRKSHIWQRQPQDWFVEPHWVNKRLFEVEFWNDTTSTIFDPAAGIGQVVRAAREHGLKASGADIVDRAGFAVQDFLTSSVEKHDSIVTNPPYKLFREFTEAALRRVRDKACILIPVARLNAARWLSDINCLRCIWLLTPRPSMPPGEKFLADGGKANGGKADFCWLVFDKGYQGEPFVNWLHRDGPVIYFMK